MAELLEISSLTKKFDDTNVTAVNNLNLKVGEREIFGIIGPDGSGKTTTLRMLCGVITPTSGTVIMDGANVVKTP